MLKNQNTDVDTVSGATYSSKGLLGAIKNALKQAEKVTNGESIEEKADTTELENAVKSAEALVMEEYTQSSWAVLSLRLNDAKSCWKQLRMKQWNSRRLIKLWKI